MSSTTTRFPHEASWRVGDLARMAGVSVRTLHHYQAIGILLPDARSSGGQRLYGPRQLATLQAIRSLVSLGLPLREVRAWLERPGSPGLEAVEAHLERLRHEITLRQRLVRRMERLVEQMRRNGTAQVPQLVEVLAIMNDIDRHYTEEQRTALSARAAELGEEGMRQAERDWATLIAGVSSALERGVDPGSPEVQGYARRWRALITAFTGGDPGTAAGLGRVWADNPNVATERGGAGYAALDQAMFEYMGRAGALLGADDTPAT
ncbi:MAG: MerR family transcriptional regulator [Candidatus Dormibacteria bacterium]